MTNKISNISEAYNFKHNCVICNKKLDTYLKFIRAAKEYEDLISKKYIDINTLKIPLIYNSDDCLAFEYNIYVYFNADLNIKLSFFKHSSAYIIKICSNDCYRYSTTFIRQDSFVELYDEVIKLENLTAFISHGISDNYSVRYICRYPLIATAGFPYKDYDIKMDEITDEFRTMTKEQHISFIMKKQLLG